MNYTIRFLLLIGYYISLVLCYWLYFKPASQDQYFEVNWVTEPTDTYAFWLAAVVAVILSALAATARDRVSDLFAVVLLLTPVMPMLVVYGDRQNYTAYVLFCAMMYAMIYGLVRLGGSRAMSPGSGLGLIGVGALSTIAVIATWMFIALDIAAGNLANLNFDFSRVYEFRRTSEELRGGALGYFETNLTSFVLGLGAVVALHRRQWLHVMLLFAGTVMIYGLTNHRAHFFVVFIALVFYWAANRRQPFHWIVGGGMITSLLSVVAYQWLSLEAVGEFSIGRVMFVPAVANFMFYDFFLEMPRMHWSDSRIGLGLTTNPYGLTGPRVIFDHFYGRDLSEDLNFGNANTGFLGSGFGHAGFIGVFLYSVCVGVILRLADAFAERTNRAISFGAFSYMFLLGLFTSSDLPTLVLTHSLLIAVLLTFAMRVGPAHAALP